MAYEFASGGVRFALSETEGLARIERRPVPLSARQRRLLQVLVQNPGRLMTREDLRACVWDGEELADGTVEHAVRAVAAALGDEPQAPLFIETLPQRGWRFLPDEAVVLGKAAKARAEPACAMTDLASRLRAAAKEDHPGPVVEEARRLGEMRDLPDPYFVALARGDRETAARELEDAA
ncbi:winged helix-turn-helix domain-containing protein [Parvularcula dongshanensis]|uniref:DNA-binding winged helix-turn-helix (WHTH) protein n=1 Tax=Parvularcula dongshanensis TaxID=1173995 RepID=A0A840I2Q3_9PROT|nr:winged helix-turn-helix domain-containing protein [Parvularcula dongshanensis]MBB4658330.1 DNA-binding winged helix-turn-helix (wHTH) protein [Parvularcula dongshanensis]